LSSMLAEKYAHALTMRDFIDLYRKLEETVGSRSMTARKCGIERRTIYGWDTTKEIRLKTRERILSVLLEELTEETLDFLTKRSVESSKDILRTFLSSLYEKAMDEATNNQEFSRLASRFDQTRQQYEGLLSEDLRSEVGGMMQYTLTHAKEIGIHLRPLPNEIISLTEFSRLIPDLVKTILVSAPYFPTSNIAKQFNLPLDFVNTFSLALHDNYIATRAVEPPERMLSLPGEQAITMATISPSMPERQTIWGEQPILEPFHAIGGAT